VFPRRHVLSREADHVWAVESGKRREALERPKPAY
jgi:hypothetical protein